jgi:nucleoside 2-deoxyribosyltransferase
MKVFITYKFKDSNPEELREQLEEFSNLIETSTDWEPFIFFRDVQNWETGKMEVDEILEKAMESIKGCDAILAEASEKARGAYFEIGYAKALGKKVIVIHKEGTEAHFLEALADVKIVYKDLDDLGEKLGKI